VYCNQSLYFRQQDP